MANNTPAHDYLLPRLEALVSDAVAHGIGRDVAVAVLIDLVTSPRFNTAAPDPLADAPSGPGWERGPDSVVLAGGVAAAPPRAIGASRSARNPRITGR